ncbi:hypothetical protein IJ579_03170 [bacterium]|nr:hypothetical protein [bacterium]
MTIKFNDLGKNYANYNFLVGQEAAKKSQQTEESQEVVKSEAVFKGLDDETDLLTKNLQNVYGMQLAKFTVEDKEIADETNAILASLGCNYRVSAAQVASVTNGMNVVVMPGMKLAENGAVAAHIQDPNGPFADLFV